MYEIVEKVAASLEAANAALKAEVKLLETRGFNPLGGISHLQGEANGQPLYMACQAMVLSGQKQSHRQQPPARTTATGYQAGKPWVDAEDAELRLMLTDSSFAGMSKEIPERSVRHQRTPWAIALRAAKLGLLDDATLQALRPQFFAKPVVGSVPS